MNNFSFDLSCLIDLTQLQRCLFLVWGDRFSTVLPICLLLQVGLIVLAMCSGSHYHTGRTFLPLSYFPNGTAWWIRICLYFLSIHHLIDLHHISYITVWNAHQTMTAVTETCRLVCLIASSSDILLFLWGKKIQNWTFYHIKLYGPEHTKISSVCRQMLFLMLFLEKIPPRPFL